MAGLKCVGLLEMRRMGSSDLSVFAKLAANYGQVALLECPWSGSGRSLENRAEVTYVPTDEVLWRKNSRESTKTTANSQRKTTRKARIAKTTRKERCNYMVVHREKNCKRCKIVEDQLRILTWQFLNVCCPCFGSVCGVCWRVEALQKCKWARRT